MKVRIEIKTMTTIEIMVTIKIKSMTTIEVMVTINQGHGHHQDQDHLHHGQHHLNGQEARLRSSQGSSLRKMISL